MVRTIARLLCESYVQISSTFGLGRVPIEKKTRTRETGGHGFNLRQQRQIILTFGSIILCSQHLFVYIIMLFTVSKNCAEIYNNSSKASGVYQVNPDGLGAFRVYCAQTTAQGGWTVLQKRLDGSVDFYRGW